MSAYRTSAPPPEPPKKEESKPMEAQVKIVALISTMIVVLASIVGVCSTVQSRIESDAKVQVARAEAETAKEQASKAMWEHIQATPVKP